MHKDVKGNIKMEMVNRILLEIYNNLHMNSWLKKLEHLNGGSITSGRSSVDCGKRYIVNLTYSNSVNLIIMNLTYSNILILRVAQLL